MLLAAPPLETNVFGLRLGDSPELVQGRFSPAGTLPKARWSQRKQGKLLELIYRCEAQDRCFSVPNEALFTFEKKKLIAATLRLDQDAAPPELNVQRLLLRTEANAGFTGASAIVAAVGRRTRYYLKTGYTGVVVQDGQVGELKLYLDARAPVGRAEAVAGGAKDSGELAALLGAQAYADAHRSIAERDWGSAAEHLEAALKGKAPPFLKTQVRLVLAMVLATRVKLIDQKLPGWQKQARADLKRARKLAPGLRDELKALAKGLKL